MRILMKLAPAFTLLAALALGACTCEPGEGADGGPIGENQVRSLIDIPESVVVGEPLRLNGSQSTGAGLVYTWTVTTPDDCAQAGEFTGDPRAEIATYVAACTGRHVVELEVSTLEGESDISEQSVDVVFDAADIDLIATLAESASFPNEARIAVDVDLDRFPDSLDVAIVARATPQNGFTQTPQVRVVGNDVFVEMAEAHGEFEIVITVEGGGIDNAQEEVLIVEADNNPPEILSFTADAFRNEEPAIVRAEVVDADGDTVSCALDFGDENQGPVFELPNAPSEGNCVFSFSTPQELNAWHIEVTASDEFEGEDSAVVIVQAGNEAPVVSNVALSTDTLNYSCGDDDCESESVLVSFDVSDDFDAPSALVYSLIDESENAPTGARIEITDTQITGSRVTLDIKVLRDDLGPLTADYAFVVVVEETTFALISNRTRVQESAFSVSVQNRAPVITNINAPDVNHTFSATYNGQLGLTISAEDAENSPLTFDVELISCPRDCAALNPQKVENGNSFSFALSSSAIADLVGEYTLLASATDAEDASSTQEITMAVLNRAPTISPLFEQSLAQNFTPPAGHEARVEVFVDPDGDPLDTSAVTISCPGNDCTGITAQILDDAFFVRAQSALANFLGAYNISGSVSDGVDSASPLLTTTVTNSAPSFIRNHAVSQSRNHLTASDLNVSAESPFDLDVSTTDPNGDPRKIVLITSRNGNADFTSPTVSGAASEDIVIELEFNSTYANLENSLTDFNVVFALEDAFGRRSTSQTINLAYLNRFPTGQAFASLIGSDPPIGDPGLDGLRITRTDPPFGARFVNIEPNLIQGARVGVQNLPCQFFLGSQICAEAFISVEINQSQLSDPDGDPLFSSYTLSCPSDGEVAFNNNVRSAVNSSRTLRGRLREHAACDGASIRTFVSLNEIPQRRYAECGINNGAVDDGLGGILPIPQSMSQSNVQASTSTTCF